MSKYESHDGIENEAKAIGEKLLGLDIHGECYVQTDREWLFMGFKPPGWDEYAVACCVPKKYGHRGRTDAFIHLVREWHFIWREGGDD